MSSINRLGNGVPQDFETASINQDQPGAPDFDPVVDAAVEVEGATEPVQKFEWNVERLFAHNPEHSLARTWAVRILSLLVGVPTLIFDIGRRIAFSLGIVNGKSFSLIDKTTEACQKVKDVFHEYMAPKELTIEEQNKLFKEKVHSLSAELVGGYEKLNGGYFYSNDSFSSPYALNAEKQIRHAKRGLIEQINAYVARNATSPDDFSQILNDAKATLWSSIVDAAQDEFYIANKVERVGEPDLLRDVAYHEVLAVLDKNALAAQFVQIVDKSSEFAAGLAKGIETGVLSNDQAKIALEEKAQQLYVQSLERGLAEAEKSLSSLLNSAIKEKIVERNEAVAIDQNISVDPDALAHSAAIDIAQSDTPEKEVKIKLIKASKDLQKAKRLKPENVSQFLTSAEVDVARARQAVEEERLRVQEESDRIEAERTAALQKAADQQSLFNQFEGMLGLIAKKQTELAGQFLKYDELDQARLETADELENIRNAKVVIRGQEITVLQAASEYYASLSVISRSQLTAVQRKQQMDGLIGQGFTQTTVDRIKTLQALEPKLKQLIDDQESLANLIEGEHSEVIRLRAIYGTFRGNHFRELETANRRSVAERETVVNRTQRALNERHAQLIGRTGIIARLRIDEPSVPINIEPDRNRQEVADLVAEFEQLQKPSAPKLEPPRSTLEKIWDGVTYPLKAPYQVYQWLRA